LNEIEDSGTVRPDADQGVVLVHDIIVGGGAIVLLLIDDSVVDTISIGKFPAFNSRNALDTGQDRGILCEIEPDAPHAFAAFTVNTSPSTAIFRRNTNNVASQLIPSVVGRSVPLKDDENITSSPILDGILLPRKTRRIDTNIAVNIVRRQATAFERHGGAHFVVSPIHGRAGDFRVERVGDGPHASTAYPVRGVACFSDGGGVDVLVSAHWVNTEGTGSFVDVSRPLHEVHGVTLAIGFDGGETTAERVSADGIGFDVGTVTIGIVVEVVVRTISVTEIVTVRVQKVPRRSEGTRVLSVGDGGRYRFSVPHNTEGILAHTRVVDTSPASEDSISIEAEYDGVTTFSSSPGNSVPTKSDVSLGIVGSAVVEDPLVDTGLEEAHLGDLRGTELVPDGVETSTVDVTEVVPAHDTTSETAGETTSGTDSVEVVAVDGGGRNVGVKTVETGDRDKVGLVDGILSDRERESPSSGATVSSSGGKVVSTIVGRSSSVSVGKSQSHLKTRVTREVIRSVVSSSESSRRSTGSGSGDRVTTTSPPKGGDLSTETIGQMVGVVSVNTNANNGGHIKPTGVGCLSGAVANANTSAISSAGTASITAPVVSVTSSVSGSVYGVFRVVGHVRLVSTIDESS